ncbi:MAG: hypothetical protein IIY94_07750, partial [Oscillospiraceae bacterium]|nr:hypothetical protein [Oscillospiraceae bacterium]
MNRKTYFSGTETRQAYSFSYDAWGNTTAIRVWQPTSDADTNYEGKGYLTLANYSYDASGKMTKMRFSSNQYVIYGYDSLDRLTREVYYTSDGSVQVEYQYIYSADGQLARQQAIRN